MINVLECEFAIALPGKNKAHLDHLAILTPVVITIATFSTTRLIIIAS